MQNTSYLNSRNDKMKQRKRLPARVREEIILQSALKVMALQGYERFTLRNVAEKSGIHLATLQYHFKTKERLLHALFKFKLDMDSQRFHMVLQSSKSDKKMQFYDAIDFILEQNTDEIVVGFFLQLWALCKDDPTAKKYLRKYYEACTNWLIELIELVHPDTGQSQKKVKAQMLLAFTEGFVPTGMCRKKSEKKELKAMQAEIKDTCWKIVSS